MLLCSATVTPVGRSSVAGLVFPVRERLVSWALIFRGMLIVRSVVRSVVVFVVRAPSSMRYGVVVRVSSSVWRVLVGVSMVMSFLVSRRALSASVDVLVGVGAGISMLVVVLRAGFDVFGVLYVVGRLVVVAVDGFLVEAL